MLKRDSPGLKLAVWRDPAVRGSAAAHQASGNLFWSKDERVCVLVWSTTRLIIKKGLCWGWYPVSWSSVEVSQWEQALYRITSIPYRCSLASALGGAQSSHHRAAALRAAMLFVSVLVLNIASTFLWIINVFKEVLHNVAHSLFSLHGNNMWMMLWESVNWIVNI